MFPLPVTTELDDQIAITSPLRLSTTCTEKHQDAPKVKVKVKGQCEGKFNKDEAKAQGDARGMLHIKDAHDGPGTAVKLAFGKRNDRKLVAEEVQKIRATYTTFGYHNEDITNAIPIMGI
ncbi:hypothetical protein Hypma_012553 [Hypsizygus marmoreus]|uniref:Uncharacterized protein n=1 Tax=Hypsizygus marmoreus TaxID=39966 RepID=A0A369JGV1_HYPMA|nr:hypothetical protein Hypma_012553 [Hypsizygus marmoreus]